MKTWNAKIWLAALVLLPPCAIAAGAAPRDDVSPAVGSLTLQWTISGRRDPVDCGAVGVERFDLTLSPKPMDSSPGEEDDWQAPCDAFEISLDLPSGTYTGEALLVDRFDRPVTLAVPVDQIDIVAGHNVVRSVDFPVAAFL